MSRAFFYFYQKAQEHVICNVNPKTSKLRINQNKDMGQTEGEGGYEEYVPN